MTSTPASTPASALARRPATCQFCLADCRNTPVATHLPLDRRCPVCGAAYTGPRRDAEYNVLLAAGLVAIDDPGAPR